MGFVAAEAGVFLEQTFLQVEAQFLGFLVAVSLFYIAQGIAVYLAIGVKHVIECLALVLGIGVEYFCWPDLVGSETLGEFDQLPQIRFGLARCVDHLVPELGATLCVAIGAFLLYPHRSRQDEVRRLRGDGWVRVRYNDKIIGIAVTG